MKKSVFLISAILVFFSGTVYSQKTVPFKKHLSFYTGMGINYGITPDFNDYLVASIPYSTSDSIKSFNAGVEFLGGLEQDISSKISAGIEYSYYIRGVNYVYSPAVFDYTITNHQPYIFVNFNFRKPNLHFKFGGAVGYHFQQMNNNVSSSTTLRYSSSGPSFRLSFTVLPKFSENFFVYLNGFAFLNQYGSLKDENGSVLKASNSTVEANLKGYGVGARLGILFNIN
ncbi:MAG: hypothetical protein ABI543_09615 [Ignavibacteria bacterium]